MLGRRRSASARRRSGPEGEARWWDPADQAAVEATLLDRRDLGRGWIPVLMVNNAERLDPYGSDAESAALRRVRDELVPTALDEGLAWRRRNDGALAVLRAEAFATDPAPLRSRWTDAAEGCLDALWRERWEERERSPGWIEARWRPFEQRPDRLRPGSPVASPAAGAVDWLTIEDHTDAEEADAVAAYEHVSVWAGRWLATVVVRHHHGDDIDAAVEGAAVALHQRLEQISRRSGPRRGSA